VVTVRPDQSVPEVWSLLSGPETGLGGVTAAGAPSAGVDGRVLA
jgi:hypothetical protein